MTDSSRQAGDERNNALFKAVEKLLRPLIRLLIARQITYPTLIGMLKKIYVDVAEHDFQVDGQRQSDSRINLLTGVHRKDVKKLRAEESGPAPHLENVSIGAQIIASWLAASEFTDADGQPRPLAQRTREGSEPGFDRLVEKFLRQDIRPRVILDEWVRLGVASIDEDNRVVLNTGAFTPSRGFEEKAFFFGRNIQDHIEAGARNLLGETPSYFDRSVYYDRLTRDSVAELGQLAEQLGMASLREMNKQALAKQKKDAKSDEARHRINFGIFNYNNAHPDDERSQD